MQSEMADFLERQRILEEYRRFQLSVQDLKLKQVMLHSLVQCSEQEEESLKAEMAPMQLMMNNIDHICQNLEKQGEMMKDLRASVCNGDLKSAILNLRSQADQNQKRSKEAILANREEQLKRVTATLQRDPKVRQLNIEVAKLEESKAQLQHIDEVIKNVTAEIEKDKQNDEKVTKKEEKAIEDLKAAIQEAERELQELEQGNSDESAQISPKSSESDDLPASQHKTPEKVQKKGDFDCGFINLAAVSFGDHDFSTQKQYQKVLPKFPGTKRTWGGHMASTSNHAQGSRSSKDQLGGSSSFSASNFGSQNERMPISKAVDKIGTAQSQMVTAKPTPQSLDSGNQRAFGAVNVNQAAQRQKSMGNPNDLRLHSTASKPQTVRKETNMLTDHSSPQTQQRTSTTVASNVPIGRTYGNGSDNHRDFDAPMHSYPIPQEAVHQGPPMAQTGHVQNSRIQAKGSDGRGDASNVMPLARNVLNQPVAKQQPLASSQANESADRRNLESTTGSANMAKSYPVQQSTSSNAPSNRMVGIGSDNRHVRFNDTLNKKHSYPIQPESAQQSIQRGGLGDHSAEPNVISSQHTANEYAVNKQSLGPQQAYGEPKPVYHPNDPRKHSAAQNFSEKEVLADYSSRSNAQNATEKPRMVTPELAHQNRMGDSGAGNRHVLGEPSMMQYAPTERYVDTGLSAQSPSVAVNKPHMDSSRINKEQNVLSSSANVNDMSINRLQQPNSNDPNRSSRVVGPMPTGPNASTIPSQNPNDQRFASSFAEVNQPFPFAQKRKSLTDQQVGIKKQCVDDFDGAGNQNASFGSHHPRAVTDPKILGQQPISQDFGQFNQFGQGQYKMQHQNLGQNLKSNANTATNPMQPNDDAIAQQSQISQFGDRMSVSPIEPTPVIAKKTGFEFDRDGSNTDFGDFDSSFKFRFDDDKSGKDGLSNVDFDLDKQSGFLDFPFDQSNGSNRNSGPSDPSSHRKNTMEYMDDGVDGFD